MKDNPELNTKQPISLRVLFIEDDPTDMKLSLLQLKKSSYEVDYDQVDNEADFVNRLTNDQYDLILSDYNLPGWTGLQAYRKLRELDIDIPFILVTGALGDESAADCIKEGIADYVLKDNLARLPVALSHSLRAKALADERKEAAKALQVSEERYRILVKTSPDAISQFDMEGRITYASPQAVMLFGYDAPEEIIGLNVFDLLVPQDRASGSDSFWKLLKEGSLYDFIATRYRKDGSTFVGESNATVVDGADGKPVSVIEVTRDVTERKRTEEELRRRSVTDDLTGLFNRSYFHEVFEREIDRMTRHGGFASLIMIDLDHFKEYNDRFGHVNGDRVLERFARMIEAQTRKIDMIFRYAGDEFFALLPSTSIENAKEIAECALLEWQRMAETEFHDSPSTFAFSAGIAQYPVDGESVDSLVFLADSALCLAKRKGGSTIALVSELDSPSMEVLGMVTMDQVYALSATVDAKDSYTYGHSKRVASLTEAIGHAIGLPMKEQLQLQSAALLHDIGKISIPDAVLHKVSRLTESEWQVIRKHCSEGARIVGYVKELLEIAPLIRHHHECYDGTGYPEGLSGNEIPRCARIISIADAYDTMTTHRPYRNILSHKEALEELQRCTGTQFDRDLVEIFCQVIDGSVRQDIYGKLRSTPNMANQP